MISNHTISEPSRYTKGHDVEQERHQQTRPSKVGCSGVIDPKLILHDNDPRDLSSLPMRTDDGVRDSKVDFTRKKAAT